MKGLSIKLTLVLNSLFFLISIAVPFLIYGYNVNNRSFDASYLSLMNNRCGKNYEQADLEKEAGTAASIVGIVFGFVYGFVLVSTDTFQSYFSGDSSNNEDNIYLNYMKGWWNFKSSCLNVTKYLGLYIIFGGVFVGVIAYGIPAGFQSFYGTYIMQTVGYCLFGLAIACWIPTLMIRL